MSKRTERWRFVKDSEKRYAVSDWGRVRESLGRGKIRLMEPHFDVANGLRVYLKGVGEKRVSHLVLEAFVGPRPPCYVARHLDDNPKNNRLDNLRWGTHQENHQDRVRNRQMRGGRKYCRAGLHLWIPENLGSNGSNGGDFCRLCRNIRQNEERRRRQSA
jgi:hypothetical protein